MDFMIYDFDELIDRRNSESVKWHSYDEDVLPMWVADMDFVSPQPVIQALQERVNHGVFGYPKQTPELLQVIIDHLEDLYGWQVLPEDLILLPGVIKGFNLACHALAIPDGSVLVQTPVYPPILKASENARVIRQESPLERVPDGSYRIDWEVFENAITPKTRVFILCNPHNPVGRVFRRLELERMAQICLQRGVVVCSDEIHGDLIYEGQQHLPIASLDPDIAQNTITLMAPSKTYNLPGLQCSFAIIQNKTLRDQFCAAMDGLVRGVNLLGMVAMVAAYQFCDEWLEQLLVYLQSNRDYLFDYVQGQLPGIKMAKPEGTYLAWLDCREAGIESNPCEFFLEKGRLALNDGLSFGQEGEGFVRMNFGCPRSLLEEGLERMKTALQPR